MERGGGRRAFGAGDVICEIETDKATVDFEAQDDGVLAKYLQPAGAEVAVGAPIMVVVEEAADAGAFSDFEAPAAAAAPRRRPPPPRPKRRRPPRRRPPPPPRRRPRLPPSRRAPRRRPSRGRRASSSGPTPTSR